MRVTAGVVQETLVLLVVNSACLFVMLSANRYVAHFSPTKPARPLTKLYDGRIVGKKAMSAVFPTYESVTRVFQSIESVNL